MRIGNWVLISALLFACLGEFLVFSFDLLGVRSRLLEALIPIGKPSELRATIGAGSPTLEVLEVPALPKAIAAGTEPQTQQVLAKFFRSVPVLEAARVAASRPAPVETVQTTDLRYISTLNPESQDKVYVLKEEELATYFRLRVGERWRDWILTDARDDRLLLSREGRFYYVEK